MLCAPANGANPARSQHQNADWLNDWDGIVDWQTQSDSFICGFYSIHSNGAEDRRWKAKYCRYPYVTTSRNSVSWVNNGGYCHAYDEADQCNCPSGKAVIGLYSKHSNTHEDRKWKLKCGKMSGVTVSSDCRWTGYKNSYDGVLNYQMPNPYVMVGFLSDHDDNKEDRRFKFRECKVTFTVQSQDLGQPLASQRQMVWTDSPQSGSFSSDNGGWYNSYDDTLNFKAELAHDGAFLCGMQTQHSNSAEDRKFKFATCSFTGQGSQRTNTWTSSYCNSWDGVMNCDCPSGRAMYGVYSKHSNNKEDRRWKLHCSKVSGITVQSDRCYETEYINGMDGSAHFETDANMVMVGMRGYHYDGTEDRRYRFKLCRVKVNSYGRRLASGSVVADRLESLQQ